MNNKEGTKNAWKGPSVAFWAVISILMMLVGSGGLLILQSDGISIETVLAGIFIVGVISTVVMFIYLLTFHDLKSGD